MAFAQEALIFGVVSAVFAAFILVWRTRRLEERLLYLLSLGSFLIAEVAILRLTAAPSRAEAEAAFRTLYLAAAVGPVPWAVLATIAQRTHRWQRIRGRSGFFGALAVVGFALATLTGSGLLFHDVTARQGHASVSLGVAGKLLLVYLTAAAGYVLTQVETLFRASLRVASRRPRIVIAVVGVAVIAIVYVATEAFLFGRLETNHLAIASVPAALACAVTGLAALKHSIDDMRFPVGRGVVYSSFALFVIGLMMILLGLLSRFAAFVGVSVDRVFFAAMSAAALLLGLGLWISPAWKRRVTGFIDENFYVNRHDYRREWERVTRSVRPSADLAEMVRSIAAATASIFGSRAVHVGILNSATDRYNVYDPDGKLVPDLAPSAEGELIRALVQRSAPVVLSDVTSDLELVPAFVEHRAALENRGISTVVPLMCADRLVGILFFTGTREGASYPPEDLSLMSVIATELSNTVYAHHLLREARERREGEALVRLSSFVLHDLKNCVSSIQGAIEGAERYMDRPAFRTDLIYTLATTGRRMASLIDRLRQVRGDRRGEPAELGPCRLGDVIRGALDAAGAGVAPNVRLELDLDDRLDVRGDPEMLEHVFVNLFRNALEAMPDGGRLTVRAHRTAGADGGAWADVTIEDTGCGMSPAFLAESLFRPFVSTKERGLGIGLFHCKNTLEDHGGAIEVRSQLGAGTIVEVKLPVPVGEEARCETAS
jgi:putative PEP-CTERM system histidine kinase